MTALTFPDGFLWGSASSGHQVEGNNIHADWWAWEQAGHIRDGTVSGRAVDYWHRFEEDHGLMQQLGYNAFRLGIEWARIEPAPGAYQEEVLDHYERMLDSLLAHGQRICLTLYHWVLPQWAAERNGWQNPDNVDAFLRVAEQIIKRLGRYPHLWITINEPMVPAIAGNLIGMFPPGNKSFKAYRTVARALLTLHARLYGMIHEQVPNAPDGQATRVGVAQAYPVLAPWGSGHAAGLYERLAVRLFRHFAYEAWDGGIRSGRPRFIMQGPEIPGLENSYDYCGINYYTRMSLRFSSRHAHQAWIDETPIPDGIGKTQMGWQIHAPGMYHTIRHVWKQFGKPIYITENGIADQHDTMRPRYILDHLIQVHRAIKHGIPVKGYFHWAFTDNFEWREGFAKRFGLVAVDHNDPDLKRIPRRSAHLLGAIARDNAITRQTIHDYAPELLSDEHLFISRDKK